VSISIQTELDIERACSERLRQRVYALRMQLAECKAWFDERANCDHNGMSYVPNEEMVLSCDIAELLKGN